MHPMEQDQQGKETEEVSTPFKYLAVSPYLVAHREAARRDIKEEEAERFALIADEWMEHLYEVSEHSRKKLLGAGRSGLHWATMIINHWLDAWTRSPAIIERRIEEVRKARKIFSPKPKDELFIKKESPRTP